MKQIIILLTCLMGSLCFSQTPYNGVWKATVADSTFTITVQTDGDNFRANFKKHLTNSNLLIYSSDISPGFYAINGTGVTIRRSTLIKGIMDDIEVTGSSLQTFNFKFQVASNCVTCPNTATFNLKYMSGVYSGSRGMRFPNNLTFVKQ